MAEPKCPGCKASVVAFEEQPIVAQGAGEMVALCCPSCHVILSVVKARPVEKAVEDAGRQVFDALGRMADKLQPR